MTSRTARLSIRSLIAVAAAVGTVVAVPGTASAAPIYPAPDADGFYSAPGNLGSARDGDVLRTRSVPAVGFPGATATQVQFRSENSAGDPIAAVTTVLVPPGGGNNRPLVSYQPFTNALGLQCAPSHTLFAGGMQEAPVLNALLARGWAVAVPDHLGPTSAYGAAKLGGRIVLDGVRAAQRAGELGLGASPVGLAGYSGGGMASEWAAALAPSYAPELNIVGVAAGGVPADIGRLGAEVGSSPSDSFGLGFAASMGLEREYPGRFDFGAALNDNGRSLAGRVANACTDQILADGRGGSLPSVTTTDFAADPSARAVLAENSLQFYPGVPTAPVYQYHGGADTLVSLDAVQQTVGRYCASGARVQFAVLPGADHGAAILAGAPGAFGYLGDRFAGVPAPTNC
ncbi:lipase [Rhodococcoides trifolii]|uniref:Lipase n=1 Tax=Rhodococcoides trifolii TaxID=908250 RepID=A0A917FUA0_9NOCA|nr:lipase family protein [Rhodococcus trifolii]GGG05822.1 lipase [Rhodococcus trifolii]